MADGEEDNKYCSNCKRDIAVSNFLMHEVHCRRNIVLCEQCQEPVPRSELDEHFEEYHAPVKCDLCAGTFDKETIENHMENECPKRTMHCPFCALDMPQSELDNHKDFCGTRTELCALCGQYIMHKDQNRHESSNCSFPIPKNQQNGFGSVPKAVNQTHNGVTGRLPGRTVNSFAMDEISRIINDPPLTSNTQGIARPNNLQSTRSRGRGLTRSTRNDIQGSSRRRLLDPIPQGTNQTDVKVSNQDREIQSPMWQDRGRQHNTDVDADHLLAMHMSQELAEDVTDKFETGLFEQASSEVVTDDILLPCEFCNSLFSAEELIIHQTGCNMFNGFLSHNLNDQNDDSLPNNSPRRNLPFQVPTALPNMVDNLSYLEAHERIANPNPDDFHLNPEIDDDTMLPCEFCDNLFPGDVLIQHQAVCDSNALNTPRTQSPIGRTNHSRNITGPLPQGQRSKQQTDSSAIAQGSLSGNQDFQSKPNGRGKGRIRSGNRNTRASNHLANTNVTRRYQNSDEFVDIPANRRRGSARRVNDSLNRFIQDPSSSRSLDLGDNGTHSRPNPDGRPGLYGNSSTNPPRSMGITGSNPRRNNKPRPIPPQNLDNKDLTEQGIRPRVAGQSPRGRKNVGKGSMRGRRHPEGDV